MHRVPHREKDGSGCEMKFYSLLPPGGFRSGPRTLRPERLKWLTTSAVNRPAFMRTILWSFCAARIARGALGRSIHEVDTVRSGALEDLATKPKNVASALMAFGHIFYEISIRLKAVNRLPLLFYFRKAAMT